MSLLEVSDLTVRYGRGRNALIAVDDISLEVDSGEALGIVGESGSGKSTLARAIVQVTPALSGRIVLDGRDVTHATGRSLRHVRDSAQMVFQDPFATLNPRMTIGTTLTEAIRLHRHRQTGASVTGVRELLDS